MNFALGPAAASGGCRLAAFAEIASTNSEALRLARSGNGGPLWLVTSSQTGGHGRRGRAWRSADGDLAATYLAVLDVPADEIASLGLVAGVALFDALATIAPSLSSRIALKWPNDLVGDGGKLAGVLIELAQSSNGHAVAVGFGVNVVAAPAGLPYPAQALRNMAAGLDAPRLFLALSDSWQGALALWDRGRGMPAICQAWLDRASGLGQPIEVSTPDLLIKGTFSMIDERGRLVIETGGGRRTVAAGEVFFGTAATHRPG